MGDRVYTGMTPADALKMMLEPSMGRTTKTVAYWAHKAGLSPSAVYAKCDGERPITLQEAILFTNLTGPTPGRRRSLGQTPKHRMLQKITSYCRRPASTFPAVALCNSMQRATGAACAALDNFENPQPVSGSYPLARTSALPLVGNGLGSGFAPRHLLTYTVRSMGARKRAGLFPAYVSFSRGATVNLSPADCFGGYIPRRCAVRFAGRRLHVSPNVEAAAV